ncbi:FtsK/SpoIIIE domain-containing protein [Acetatifactor muris]|uniref:FtsK/SpoIIIE domain-containing protein n=1 Tax=Acetatifactor muris TaxID=879566 RepID=UPI0023F37D47|nr:FtsK/SpoIIIE domain-containing protein [Acetatifactor muris]
MEKNQETIDGLLACLDEAIFDRDRRNESLDGQYKLENGHVLSRDYSEYMRRRKNIGGKFREEALDCQRKLDELCRRIRKAQPALADLDAEHVNRRGRFPRNIALGKLHVRYENLDFSVPKIFRFPFERPMYICDDRREVLLHKVLLRLLYALPVDRQEYYIFDPMGLGKTVNRFNSLFSMEKLFPRKKVMITASELKAVLKDVTEYIRDLQSNVFRLDMDCMDWDSYNRRLYSQGQSEKMLPYKVFLFTAVPDGMDQDCFDMFRTLIVHGRQCGLLVLFSFNRAILDAEEGKMRKTELELRDCIAQSRQLHRVFAEEGKEEGYSRLTVTNVGERFPDDRRLSVMLEEIKYAAEECSGKGNSIDEIMNAGELFDCNSADGLTIPIGCGASGNSRLDLKIGDETPHYLVGGATGSGKSSLLHTLILSACSRYSPEELRLYLLDFKEGVEFCQYADPVLSHAALVATEADTEYGVTVLEHLVREKERRYTLFKEKRCKNIQGYRQADPTEKMPRILVIIDEFQVLFADAEKAQTIATMEMLAKQGRACGIHLILATQSLKGLDFSTLGAQFGGRIALRCPAEDSKLFLGGITSNNEAAADLKVPVAILNTSQGAVSGNIKFAFPWAGENDISRRIALIAGRCHRENIHTRTRIFEGQTLPVRPVLPEETGDGGLHLYLGEKMDYSAEAFVLTLRPKMGNHVLFCGHDDILKKSLLYSVILSGEASPLCEEILYIGDMPEMIPEEIRGKTECLPSTAEFVSRYKDRVYEKRTIVILDNCNLTKETGYQPVMYGTPSEGAAFIQDFVENANKNGCYLIAFYEGKNRIKSCGIPKEEFNYRIGYAVNGDEKNDLLGSNALSSAPVKKNRAFAVDNLDLYAWFRPYSQE